MAVNIDILTTGYATVVGLEAATGGNSADRTIVVNTKFMKATGSCCLVRSGGVCMLFDTMGPWEKDSLIAKLSERMIHPDDIQYLICSHSHPDHIGNINLFTKARKHFVGTSVYTNDVYDLNCFEPTGSFTYKNPRCGDKGEVEVIRYQSCALDSHVTVEPTPGHTMECISLIATSCDTYGTVGLAGDLFENEDDIEDEGIWMAAGSQKPDLQRANRSVIYNKVDFILPGHGSIFSTKNPKGIKLL